MEIANRGLSDWRDWFEVAADPENVRVSVLVDTEVAMLTPQEAREFAEELCKAAMDALRDAVAFGDDAHL
jgi:hypothetical protein